VGVGEGEGEGDNHPDTSCSPLPEMPLAPTHSLCEEQEAEKKGEKVMILGSNLPTSKFLLISCICMDVSFTVLTCFFLLDVYTHDKQKTKESKQIDEN
jgi:hypothetical protein